MMLSPPNASQLPTSINININSAVAKGYRIADQVRMDLAVGSPVSIAHSTYRDHGDGRDPADPNDFYGNLTGSESPALAQAVDSLRALAHTTSWSGVRTADPSAREYATVHLTYAARPTDLPEHASAHQLKDGTWLAMLRTSRNDLLADPTLAPVVDAALAVNAAARAIA